MLVLDSLTLFIETTYLSRLYLILPNLLKHQHVFLSRDDGFVPTCEYYDFFIPLIHIQADLIGGQSACQVV